MKDPKTATVLGFFLGPIGYLYIGWRYTLASSASLLAFLALIAVVSLLRVAFKYPGRWRKKGA